METKLSVYLKEADIFQHKTLVLKNISLEISKGELVYLIGKTGSGKSSLLKTFYGALPLQKGKGMIAGYALEKLKKRDIPFLRRKLGIVFQDFQLLTDRSAEKNLEFVLKATGWKKQGEIKARIAEVLEQAGLGTKAHKLPHQLSGGEQQRLAIARAMLNKPEVILADEPTGNLDPETSAGIIQLFQAIAAEGKTVLIATHDYALFDLHQARTLKCDNGTILDSNLL